ERGQEQHRVLSLLDLWQHARDTTVKGVIETARIDVDIGVAFVRDDCSRLACILGDFNLRHRSAPRPIASSPPSARSRIASSMTTSLREPCRPPSRRDDPRPPRLGSYQCSSLVNDSPVALDAWT